MFIITNFNIDTFLADYWQKKPCLIKHFVPDFIDPIDENDLAGLAQEDDVDSRIVSNQKGCWQVDQGPFADFESVCKGNWSLLVQGVDRYIPEVNALSQLVEFIPNWRFDDVMVSYSTANAGVGAHTDEYDVFIIQGQGTRRWQVGLPSNAKTIIPHPLLKQIEGFDAVIDEILEPGDAIYIPPKHPHNGLALEACLNYSMGFRAPTNVEVLTGLLDESDNITALQTRYTDPEISTLRPNGLSPMAVSVQELDKLKANMIELLHSPQADEAILQYLSRQGLVTELDIPLYETQEIQNLLDQGHELVKLSGVKPIFKASNLGIFSFFIDGNVFEVEQALTEQTIALLEGDSIKGYSQAIGNNASDKASWVSLVTQLVNAGYWYEVE